MKRHRMDLLSLVAGLAFAGVAMAAFAGEVGATVSQLRWVGAILLTALGIGLVVSARTPQAGRTSAQPESGESDRS